MCVVRLYMSSLQQWRPPCSSGDRPCGIARLAGERGHQTERHRVTGESGEGGASELPGGREGLIWGGACELRGKEICGRGVSRGKGIRLGARVLPCGGACGGRRRWPKRDVCHPYLSICYFTNSRNAST